MKIIVVGCGKIGCTVLSHLASEGHDVTAMDSSLAVVTKASDVYDVMTMCGNCVNYDDLVEAGAEHADILIATTQSDELNMLCCFLAKKMGTKHTVARMRNPQYTDKGLGFMKQQLNISMILNPEQQVAREIFNILKFPSAIKIENFSRGIFEMAEIKITTDVLKSGMSVKELREKFNANFLICVVQRGKEVFIPNGNFVIEAGDRIGITAAPIELQKLFKQTGILKKQAKSVMILGGGKTTFYLAKMLSDIGIAVKIIEKDEKRCQDLSTAIPGAIILHADGTNRDVLLEEGITETDAFVALTGVDENNLLVSISAFMQGNQKVITKVNNRDLYTIGEKIGLDCLVSPLDISTGTILRYARALANGEGSKVETLYKLMDDRAEAIEFKVSDDAPVLGVPLKDLKLKKNILIGGIIRGRKAIIPSGNDAIQPDDRVVVIASGILLNDLADIVAK